MKAADFWGRFGVRTILFFILISLYGCGSTVRGVGKDFSRVGRGIKTIFVSDEAEQEKAKQPASFWDYFKVQGADSQAKK
ncbi:MAG TPA: hypothetical protein PKL97_07385 [Candidatus Omnitrophota bacterium]|nr:hypothetical protein [Candidatus Omnitrophota bacterium]